MSRQFISYCSVRYGGRTVVTSSRFWFGGLCWSLAVVSFPYIRTWEDQEMQSLVIWSISYGWRGLLRAAVSGFMLFWRLVFKPYHRVVCLDKNPISFKKRLGNVDPGDVSTCISHGWRGLLRAAVSGFTLFWRPVFKPCHRVVSLDKNPISCLRGIGDADLVFTQAAKRSVCQQHGQNRIIRS